MELLTLGLLFAFVSAASQFQQTELLSGVALLVLIGYVTGTGPWWSYFVVPSLMFSAALFVAMNMELSRETDDEVESGDSIEGYV